MSQSMMGYEGKPGALPCVGDVVQPAVPLPDLLPGTRYVVDELASEGEACRILLSEHQSGFYLPGVYEAKDFRLVGRKS